LQVPEDEEAICSALEMESRSDKAAVDITTSDKNKAVQKGLVMDISRVLGVLDFEKNSKPLSEQLRLVQKELVDCTHPSEKELLKTVAHLLESVVAVEPEFVRRSSTSDAGENEPLPPFEAFLCPLTKQVRLFLSLGMLVHILLMCVHINCNMGRLGISQNGCLHLHINCNISELVGCFPRWVLPFYKRKILFFFFFELWKSPAGEGKTN
jgi:hypothetical protein